MDEQEPVVRDVPATAAETGSDTIASRRRRRTIESAGEFLLLATILAFFAYLWLDSRGWALGAALIPRISVAVGLPLVLIRLITVLRRTASPPSTQIMDTGFRSGGDPVNEAKRFVKFVTHVVAMCAGIVLFGAHTAVPVSTSVTLYASGRLSAMRAVLIGVAVLTLIVIVYDLLIGARWPDPVLANPLRDMVASLLGGRI